MMKRASIRIWGDVQMVGFRTFTEISSLRGDIRSYMEEKCTKIEHDVEVIKAKIGMA
ncbi:MAG: hypothetical protein KAT65_10015 [Methanophagales archaeon]|nr:hypothetical protein [Methanophagales archaeon]